MKATDVITSVVVEGRKTKTAAEMGKVRRWMATM